MIYAGDGGVGDVDSNSDFATRRNLDIGRPSYANLNRLIGQVYNDIRFFCHK